MFCPTCGKDNPLELKFCASCGTNLEAVTMALSGREEDFFTKMDSSIDQFVGRYAEHVFKDAPLGLSDHKVSKSWRLLGQAVLTTLVDLLLFTLMWNILPLRFLILVVSTPFRLLSERGKQQAPDDRPPVEDYKSPELHEPLPQLWLTESIPSVTESTTVNLGATEKKVVPTTDSLK